MRRALAFFTQHAQVAAFNSWRAFCEESKLERAVRLWTTLHQRRQVAGRACTADQVQGLNSELQELCLSVKLSETPHSAQVSDFLWHLFCMWCGFISSCICKAFARGRRSCLCGT